MVTSRKRVVISQPMFFPWVGMFEQIRLADVYVHYADVQFSKGSFVNRVQIKTIGGIKWLTVPLKRKSLRQRIDEVEIDDSTDWRRDHFRLLSQAYAKSPYCNEMLKVVRRVYDGKFKTIDELAINSMEVVVKYFNLAENTRFLNSRTMNIGGSNSQRVLDIVRAVDGNIYITGHGGKNYLDHESFETNGVRVEYMDYQKTFYPQLHGEFTPYVSILDLIANVAIAGKKHIHSGSNYWKNSI
jgi:hypothetical protein